MDLARLRRDDWKTLASHAKPGNNGGEGDEAFWLLYDAIGRYPTFDLLQDRGGSTIQIPAKHLKFCYLFPIIGEEAANRLIELRRGEKLRVPLATPFRVLVMREQGFTRSQICVRLCVSDGHVTKVMKSAVANRHMLLSSMRRKALGA